MYINCSLNFENILLFVRVGLNYAMCKILSIFHLIKPVVFLFPVSAFQHQNRPYALNHSHLEYRCVLLQPVT